MAPEANLFSETREVDERVITIYHGKGKTTVNVIDTPGLFEQVETEEVRSNRILYQLIKKSLTSRIGTVKLFYFTFNLERCVDEHEVKSACYYIKKLGLPAANCRFVITSCESLNEQQRLKKSSDFLQHRYLVKSYHGVHLGNYMNENNIFFSGAWCRSCLTKPSAFMGNMIFSMTCFFQKSRKYLQRLGLA